MSDAHRRTQGLTTADGMLVRDGIGSSFIAMAPAWLDGWPVQLNQEEIHAGEGNAALSLS